MGAQQNIDLIKSGYAAFASGDMATLHGLFAEDAVWTTPGTSQLSGPKTGRSAILGFFAELVALTNGVFSVSVLDIQGGDERVYVLQHSHAERNGKVFEETSVTVFTVVDDKVATVDQYTDDTGQAADFWG